MSDRTWTLPETRKRLSRKDRKSIFMKTDGRCYICTCRLEVKGWDAEHPQALELLGPDDVDALMPICKPCHKVKTGDDRKVIAKCNKVRDKHTGIIDRSSRRGGFSGKFKKKMNGDLVNKETGEVIRRGRS